MTKKMCVLLLLAIFFILPVPSLAQTDTAPEGIGEEAVEALGEDRGKTEEEQLEEILSSQRNEYDLIASGNMKLNYSLNYSYASTSRLQFRDITDTGFTIFDLNRDSQHTLNNSFSYRYGFFNNLTVGINVPIVAKYNSTTYNSVSTFGDVSLSSRYQPFISRPGQMRMTTFSNVSLPTGRSPYEIDRDQELSSGSGLYSVSAGFNVSKAVDPVVAFGNFGLNYSLPKDGLEQGRGNRLLIEIAPGPSISLGGGMAYSLSYDVSLTYSFNYSYSLPAELTFIQNGNEVTVESNPSTSATFNISTGWRLDPTYTLNVGLGMGLTRDSPDFSLSLGFPLVLETPGILDY